MKKLGWEFTEFFINMAPVTMPVLAIGLISCALIEISKKFGYGYQIPEAVKSILAIVIRRFLKESLIEFLTLLCCAF